MPLAVVVTPTVPVKNLAEFASLARAQPKHFTWAVERKAATRRSPGLTPRKRLPSTASDDRTMSSRTPFEQLLAKAVAQADPQVLLFVFADATLPADASPAQRARFEAGCGGELTPLMCVEKPLDELTTFDALVAESRDIGPPWALVFAAGLGGHGGRPPDPQAVAEALKTMVERVRNGAVEAFLALTPAGDPVHFV